MKSEQIKTIPLGAIWAGIGAGISFWLIDTAIDSFFKPEISLTEHVLPSGTELSMRVLALFLFAGLGAFFNHREDKRLKAEVSLREDEEVLRSITDTAHDAVIMVDGAGDVLFWNKAAERIFGYIRGEILGKSLHLFIIPPKFQEEHLKGLANFRDTGHGPLIGKMVEVQAVRKDGAEISIELSLSTVKIKDAWCAVGIARDISEHKRAEAEMVKLSFAVENSSDWILITDRDGSMTYVNKAVEAISGYKKDELIGQNPRIFSSGRHDKSFYEGLWGTVLSGHTFRGMITNRKKDGKIYELYHTITPLRNGREEITSFVSTSKDISQQKEMEDRLNYLAYYDVLTGLPNRSLLIDRLSEGIARLEHNKRYAAVLSIDIDRFKFINDALGIGVGDKVLAEVGKMLSGFVRDGDTVARPGADKFAVSLVDIADPKDVILVAEKIKKGFSQPLKVEDEETVLTISMGISVYPGDGNDALDLMKNADQALSRVKKDGGNGYYFYDPALEVKSTEFVMMERKLFGALRNGEFVLHYQPYVDTASAALSGAEALMRWNSPELGQVPPGKFISVLEDTKMIIEAGEWGLMTALKQFREWQDEGYPVIPVSVNLSPIQFRQRRLFETVNNILKDSGLPPNLLTLEITESTFMQDIDFTVSVLKDFKDIGVSISIDDFGTGHSSLSYLKKFPVDNLKMDISFIRDITSSPDAASIVNAIITMAHSLHIKTIAEGVETEEQWKALRLLKCDMIQGFFFYKPMPAADFERMLRTSGATGHAA